MMYKMYEQWLNSKQTMTERCSYDSRTKKSVNFYVIGTYTFTHYLLLSIPLPVNHYRYSFTITQYTFTHYPVYIHPLPITQ